ncbi:MAG: phosphate-binding protein, partial [Planctomycetota bacterium]
TAVTPSSDTIEGGSYAPFSRPLFIYVSKRSAARPEVRAFVNFYLAEGPALAEEVGYVQLPREVQQLAKKKFDSLHTGTHFLTRDGEKKSGPVTDLYK